MSGNSQAQHDQAEHAVLMGRRDERDDVLAYLEQRRDNAELMARRSPEFADAARERQRQLTVIIEEFRVGLHDGAAAARAALIRWAGPAESSAPALETHTSNEEVRNGGEVAA